MNAQELLDKLKQVQQAFNDAGLSRQALDIDGIQDAIKATKEKVLPALETYLAAVLPEVMDSEGNIKLGWSIFNPANWGKLGRIAKATVSFIQAVIAAYKTA